MQVARFPAVISLVEEAKTSGKKGQAGKAYATCYDASVHCTQSLM